MVYESNFQTKITQQKDHFNSLRWSFFMMFYQPSKTSIYCKERLHLYCNRAKTPTIRATPRMMQYPIVLKEKIEKRQMIKLATTQRMSCNIMR